MGSECIRIDCLGTEDQVHQVLLGAELRNVHPGCEAHRYRGCANMDFSITLCNCYLLSSHSKTTGYTGTYRLQYHSGPSR